ncbi:GAP family protein [Microbacterium foliorum]|uniref:GAP family protein n=1 Tax=Microbacterium foliorum TaxID=104336 RepID=UPI001DE42A53|nr:GAP family protein [Microbacterium foliorum]CAH0249257.1 hypothetical protein SRABI44_03114 [Microbacterium foliorum]CAH0249613.1 hypothetical protein SRABI03_03181 [Microbacterium foliorum]
MELFGGLPLPLSLALLALLDGLSVGTLLIPVFLLLAPGRVRIGRILLYLATIAAFYLVIGLLFLWGLVNLVDVAAELLASPAGQVTRLVVGGTLLLTAIFMPTGDTRSSRRTTPRRATSAGSPAAPSSVDASAAAPTATVPARAGRVTRWRDRLLDPRTRGTAIMGVAIAAGLVEVATMLPYIVGMTMLADAGVATPFRVVALVGYCVLMIVPALLLLLARLVAAPLVQRPLERFADWLQRTGAETTAWVVGIIGFLVARSAATDLGLFQAIG